MKTIVVSLLSLLICVSSFAQDPTDALRYSFLTGEGGTARNQALGGAGGSLGGEFSSLFMNPAGLGFFKTGDLVITPTFLMRSNDATYQGGTASSEANKFGIGTSGILFASEHRNRKIRNVTLGLGISKSANFYDNLRYQGTNKSTSYSQKFVEEFERDGVRTDDEAGRNYPYGSSMAFNTYLVNPILNASDEITGFYSLARPSYGLQQTMEKYTSGSITDIAIGVGANHMDELYFGGTLGIPILKYRREAFYSEDDVSGDPNNDFNYFDADELLETKGVGINLKVGAIYKPRTDVQVGLVFTMPTFFQLTDLYNMTITTDPEGYEGKGVQSQSSTYLNDDNFLRANYNLITPLRLMLSGTYFISTGEVISEQKGFITGDIEFVSYRGANFRDAANSEAYRSYFRELNAVIDDIYRPAINARLGGELKLNTFMVRLGGAYYGNPYKNNEASLAKVTGGVGYRSGPFYVDLAYAHSFLNTVDYPYRLERQSVTPASITGRGHNIALTVGFKLY